MNKKGSILTIIVVCAIVATLAVICFIPSDDVDAAADSESFGYKPYNCLNFTFPVGGGTIKIVHHGSGEMTPCCYSFDTVYWITIQEGEAIEVNGNQRMIYIMAENTHGFSFSGDNYNTIELKTNNGGCVDVNGNIMSLLHDEKMKSIPSKYCFYRLFKDCKVLGDASGLELPATEITECCYKQMFMGCKSLTSIPEELPAKTVPYDAYESMFEGCTSLTHVPEICLPATKVAERSYDSMFEKCTSLTNTPVVFPATTMAEKCYFEMFRDCTSLKSVSVYLLPGTILANHCYDSMFEGCTSLTNVPELPAMKMAESCYEEMFRGCTSLVSVSRDLLPGTSLAKHCYDSMFEKCTSIVDIPMLPATSLANHCYKEMFRDCTSIATATPLDALKLKKGCYEGMYRGCISLKSAPLLDAPETADDCYDDMFRGCKSLDRVWCMADDWFWHDDRFNDFNRWLDGVKKGGTLFCDSDAHWTTWIYCNVPDTWELIELTRPHDPYSSGYFDPVDENDDQTYELDNKDAILCKDGNNTVCKNIPFYDVIHMDESYYQTISIENALISDVKIDAVYAN